MKIHEQARTCPHCRQLIVSRVLEDGQSPSRVACDFESLLGRSTSGRGGLGSRVRRDWKTRVLLRIGAREDKFSPVRSCTTQSCAYSTLRRATTGTTGPHGACET